MNKRFKELQVLVPGRFLVLRNPPRGLRARSRVLKYSFVMRVAASGQLVARQKFMPDEIRRMTSTKMSRIIAMAVVATDHPQLPRDNKNGSVIFRKIIPRRDSMFVSMFHASRFTFKNESKEIRNMSFTLPHQVYNFLYAVFNIVFHE